MLRECALHGAAVSGAAGRRGASRLGGGRDVAEPRRRAQWRGEWSVAEEKPPWPASISCDGQVCRRGPEASRSVGDPSGWRARWPGEQASDGRCLPAGNAKPPEGAWPQVQTDASGREVLVSGGGGSQPTGPRFLSFVLRSWDRQRRSIEWLERALALMLRGTGRCSGRERAYALVQGAVCSGKM